MSNKNKEQIRIELEKEVIASCIELAKVHNRSISAQINELLKLALSKDNDSSKESD